MNYGLNSKKLLESLKKSDWLSLYDDRLIKAIENENNNHIDKLTEMKLILERIKEANRNSGEEKKEFDMAMALHLEALKRNKRALLAYHMYRLSHITTLRLLYPAPPQSLAQQLSPSELQFFHSYDDILTDYCVETGVNLNEFAGSENGAITSGGGGSGAPRNAMIQVRVKIGGVYGLNDGSGEEGVGEIMTEGGGSVKLDERSVLYLRRGDVEGLIREGVLEEIEGEEG